MSKLFPTTIIALSAASGVVYLVHGNWRMALYWLAAATLNAAVTY